MRIIPFMLDIRPGALSSTFAFMRDGRSLESGPRASISLRIAGDMGYSLGPRTPQRQAVFVELGIDAAQVVGRSQIHSKQVLPIEGYRADLEEGDGLATVNPDLVLSVTGADCMPIYLFDTQSGARALLHSGWKGTGIVLEALSVMKERYGTKPEAVSAIFGPCIGVECYEVDADRARFFGGEYGSASVREQAGRWYLDLREANRALLERSGVRDLAVCMDCTACDERLGSFRREACAAHQDQSAGSKPAFTRMMALLGHGVRGSL